MAHTVCVLNAQGYKHTLKICNTYCFPLTTKFKRRWLNVQLHGHCLLVKIKAKCVFCEAGNA